MAKDPLIFKDAEKTRNAITQQQKSRDNKDISNRKQVFEFES